MIDLAQLNHRFGSTGAVTFRHDAALGCVVADIVNDDARCVVALKGAQVTSWTPSGQRDVLWLSPVTPLDVGKAMRGGIPVCWPWFADHPHDPSQPFHGLVRTVDWEPLAVATAAGGTRLTLGLPASETTALPLRPRLDVEVGKSLRVTLTTENTGPQPVQLTEALHTYFAISDIADVSVAGLEGTAYLDKVAAFARKQQEGSILFVGETDRIYLSGAPTKIIDPGYGRAIHVRSEGSGATVVWNAGPDRAARMADLPGDTWKRYVCVETANAADAAVTLAPGAVHRLIAEISVSASAGG